MSIFNKHNSDYILQHSLLNNIFGEDYPKGEVKITDSRVNVHLLQDKKNIYYNSTFHKHCPYNDFYISGVNTVGMIFQLEDLPEDFKIHNQTGNQIYLKEKSSFILSGDLVMENINLDLMDDYLVPSLLGKKFQKVNSIDFGIGGGVYIRFLESIPGNYKRIVYDKVLQNYYSYKENLGHLTHFQLVINVVRTGRVIVYMDFQDPSKCYFI